MSFWNKQASQRREVSQKPEKKKSKKIFLIIGGILLIFFGVFLWWLFNTLFTVAPNAGVVNSIFRSIPGVTNSLKSLEDGRTNIALFGMRGEGVEGGGLLADTIMVASIYPESEEVSLVSIPRDLYVTVPETTEKRKINAVHALGEEKERGQGLEDMKTVLSEVLGQEIHYATSINFEGFKQIIDALGGVEITLESPFEEPVQFNEPRVCDSNVFTKAFQNESGVQMYECKYSIKSEEEISPPTSYTLTPPSYCYNKPEKSGYLKVKAQYPLCTNPDTECGGNFKLPAGEQTLNGEQTLCFVRSRATSSDFDRARRQQEVLKELKSKALSLGFFTDFEKMSGVIKALGNNVRTDLQLWEMKELLGYAENYSTLIIRQKVLENSEEGLLYHPVDAGSAGYILLPRGDSYEKIHEMFATIITKPSPSEEVEKQESPQDEKTQ
jgi:LCP family protein required for cell wall assembly